MGSVARRSAGLAAFGAVALATASATPAQAGFFCQNGQLYTLKSNPPGQNLYVPCNKAATTQLLRNTLNSWQQLYGGGLPVQTGLNILAFSAPPPPGPGPADDEDEDGDRPANNNDESAQEDPEDPDNGSQTEGESKKKTLAEAKTALTKP